MEASRVLRPASNRSPWIVNNMATTEGPSSTLRVTIAENPEEFNEESECVENKNREHSFINFRVQELCESRGGCPGLSVLMSVMVSVDAKQH